MRTILSTSIIAGLSLGLTACNFDSSSDSSAKGYYQFVNLVGQSPSIEVLVDEESIGELEYAAASTIEYVSKGSYELEFNQILPNSENPEFTSGDSLTVSKNTLNAYIMYGDTGTPSTLTISTDISDLFDDDFDEDYDSIIQFANLADPDVDIDVYWLDEGDDLLNQVADYSLSYGDASGEFEIEAGDYKLVLTESGTDNIIASSDNISISSGNAQTFVLTGYLVVGGDALVNGIVEIESDGARMLVNEAQAATVRFSHGISGTDYLDVYLTDTDPDTEATLLANAVEFGGISDQVDIVINDVGQGDTRYFYLSDNSTDEKIDTFSVDLQPSSRLLVLTSGDTTSTITVNDNEEDLRIIDTHAKLLVSHSIDDIKSDGIEVIIASSGGNPDSYSAQVELSYMGNDEYEVESGDYDIYIYNAASGELIIETNLRGVETGDVINLIATDYAYAGTPYQLQTYFNY